MGYIIVARNPSNDRIVIINDYDTEEPTEFASADDAEKAAKNTTVCEAWGYQIVEID